MKKTRKIKVIGAGGIGSCLIDRLSQYLNSTTDSCEVTIIDGDKYEEKNKDRQCFKAYDNKAEHTVNRMKEDYPKVHFRATSSYLTDDNVITAIREDDVVFLGVDNHATRKLVSDRCRELKNVTLISGGNDYTDGNVINYLRKDGKDVTKSPTDLYPKIANPEDVNPGTIKDVQREGCQEQAATNPQLLITNNQIAATMLNCYYAYEQGKYVPNQVFVDIVTQRSRPTTPDNI